MKPIVTGMKLLVMLGICLASGLYVYNQSLMLVEPEEPQRTRPPMTVELVRTTRATVNNQIELTGNIQANAIVQVRSRVDGYIQDIGYSLGEHVRHNQSLIQLDPSRQQELLLQAQSALKIVESQLAAKKLTRDLASQDWERVQQFLDSSIYTEQQQLQIRTQLDIARSEVALAEAQVAEAESILQSRKIELEELDIKAPMSGMVAERFAEPGDLAKSDLPIITLINIDQVKVLVNVAEKDYQNLQPGQTAYLQVDALPDLKFQGLVHRKAPVLDPATRTATVEIEVPNPDYLLKPGMHARATVVSSEQRQSVTVPAASLVDRDGRSVVYVFDQQKGIVNEKTVQPGLILFDVVEILSGVPENTPVVRLGSRMIEDGQQVAVVWAEEKNSPNAAE